MSSRDRKPVSVDDGHGMTIARTPPPAFLFPINDVKDLNGLRRTHRLRPAAARRRVSKRDPGQCQPLCDPIRKARFRAQRSPRGPQGHAPSVLGDSIEGAETRPGPAENQALIVRFRFAVAGCSRPEEARVLSMLRWSRKRHREVAPAARADHAAEI